MPLKRSLVCENGIIWIFNATDSLRQNITSTVGSVDLFFSLIFYVKNPEYHTDLRALSFKNRLDFHTISEKCTVTVIFFFHF